MLSTNDDDYACIENVYNEIKSRHAKIIFITNNEKYIQDNDKENVLLIPKNKTYDELLGVLYLQMIAYKIAISKGINPDYPKNLAKVVTV
jgi:glucosamine--fructose-6-phosphate aminotransferase (isomerizing)